MRRLLTMERRRPTVASFVIRATGLRIVRPSTYWGVLGDAPGRRMVSCRPAGPITARFRALARPGGSLKVWALPRQRWSCSSQR